jgi:nitrile hydratase subunit beta
MVDNSNIKTASLAGPTSLQQRDNVRSALSGIILAVGEAPRFQVGDNIRILTRAPVGHFRVPNYIRGKRGRVEAVIEPRAVNNEDEGFGRNAGEKRHYYRIAIPFTDLWLKYVGSPNDGLRIEVFETWLERI